MPRSLSSTLSSFVCHSDSCKCCLAARRTCSSPGENLISIFESDQESDEESEERKLKGEYCGEIKKKTKKNLNLRFRTYKLNNSSIPTRRTRTNVSVSICHRITSQSTSTPSSHCPAATALSKFFLFMLTTLRG